MKKLGIFIFSLVAFILTALIPQVNSQIRPYVSGDTINYNGKAYIGTTNTGSFELFRLVNDSINKELNIQTHDEKFQIFHDLSFSIEEDRLFVYLVNGRDLLKYDISSLASIRLVKKVKDNSGDYFFGLGSAGNDRLYTIGSKGVKVWNQDLVVVNSYKIELDYNQNVAFNGSGTNLYVVDKEKLKVIDAFWRYDLQSTDLYIRDNHNRKPFIDNASGDVFVVDDGYFNKIKPDGKIESFQHIAQRGYDVAGSVGRDHVYFSDGVGLVKIRKNDLRPLAWEWTTSLGGGNGWAMGLETLETAYGEKVVVFNGSSILVLNDNLSVYDYYQAQENEPDFKPLQLSLSRYRALPHMLVTVYGSGFGLSEEIEVQILGKKHYTVSDASGNFQINLSIPSSSPQETDIKATGLISAKTYSIGFKID